jgi:alpha-1,3-rhamnosyl/mannosyltransferase
VITDSNFSAAEIAAAYGIPAARLTVVPLGVDEAQFSRDDPGSTGELPAGVRTPFLLHVGDLHERRNLQVVVEAMAIARRQGLIEPELSLVLAGVDRGLGAAISEMASRAGLAEIVVQLGAVTEPQLRMLYRQATALVYPSLYEGFGLPVLEAMASGTPVLGSRSSSIPEVLGDAGVLLDPLDAAAWADAIVRIVYDEAERARMRAAGRHRAAGFTWERTARETLAVYRRTVRRH